MSLTTVRSRLCSQQGTSLAEVLVGSLIGAVLVAGLMAAFLTALRVSARGGGNVEAASYVQQTLERFRNRVACDDSWFGGANCGATPPPATPNNDPLGGALYGGTRTYTVTPADCDGPGGTTDNCLKVVTEVSWTQPQ